MTGTGDREPERGRVRRERDSKVLFLLDALPQGEDAEAQVGRTQLSAEIKYSGIDGNKVDIGCKNTLETMYSRDRILSCNLSLHFAYTRARVRLHNK